MLCEPSMPAVATASATAEAKAKSSSKEGSDDVGPATALKKWSKRRISTCSDGYFLRCFRWLWVVGWVFFGVCLKATCLVRCVFCFGGEGKMTECCTLYKNVSKTDTIMDVTLSGG